MTEALSTVPIDELRARRARLNAAEDEVSYTRRVAQTRLDLVRRRQADGSVPLAGALREVLVHQAVSSSPRPPRDTSTHEESPSAHELELLCADYGFARLDELDEAGLEQLAAELERFEKRISGDRKRLFAEIDELSGELVRRYRDGSAEVDTLWKDSE